MDEPAIDLGRGRGISIRPTPPGVDDAPYNPDNGPFAPYKPPEQAAAAPGAAPDTPDGDAGPFAPYKPPDLTPPKPVRQQGGAEATARGVLNSLSFGFAPAIAGLAEASGMPSTAANGEPTKENEIDINPARPIVGAAKLLHGWLTDHPDPAVVEAYNRGRESYGKEQKNAEEQHFWPYVAGQLFGAVATPMGAAGGVTAIGRAGRMIGSGAVTGGLNEAGEKTSEGKGVKEVAVGAAKGTGTGAVIGGVVGGTTHAAGTVAGRVGSAVRGSRNPDAEAERLVNNAFAHDNKVTPTIIPKEVSKVAQEANVPAITADFGGGSTRALARVAADTSPVAHFKLNSFINDRFHDQNGRFATWIRSKLGGNSAASMADDLKVASRAANKPLYQRAYAVGAGGVWNDTLERLTSAPAVQEAASAAVRSGRNRAVAEGFGGYAEKIKINPDGSVTLGNGNIPTLQFWDYIQRELRQASDKAFRAGANEEGDALRQLHKQLLGELDVAVPEFGKARGTAAKFFKANDAIEAGQNFLADLHVDPRAAAKIIAGMSPIDREMFRVGFMSDMADKIANTSNGVSLINAAFLTNPAAKLKIMTALGPKETKEFEALLRAETIVDQLRPWLGGSQTSRNLGHGAGAGETIGMVEAAKEGGFSPKTVLISLFGMGAIKSGLHQIDARVMEKVADLLLSSDPAFVKRGVSTIAGHGGLLGAMRGISQEALDVVRRGGPGAVARTTNQDAGADASAAAIVTGAEYIASKGVHADHHHHHNDPIASQIDANQ